MAESEAITDARRQFLLDPNMYLSSVKFNSLIKDEGVEMTTTEKNQLKTRLNKNFSKKIRCGIRLYPKLYALAELFYYIFVDSDKGAKWFTKLPKSKSDTVHKMGRWIVSQRAKIARGDIHSHASDELIALADSEAYKDQEYLFYLSQRDFLNHFFGVWGIHYKNMMKPEVDNKLRLLGILMTLEDVREFIPDILNKRRGQQGWRNLDAASGRTAAAWPLIVSKFIDPEVEIKFPSKWDNNLFKEKINSKTKDDNFYELNGNFNLNNKERMKLPWSRKSLEVVLKVTRDEYADVMKMYMMGTGGGPGHPENFVVWQERDKSYILDYTPQQAAMLYLTIVFMWDKEYGFILSPTVGKIPQEIGHEDETYGGADGGNDSNNRVMNSSRSSATKGKRSNSSILCAIESMNEHRALSTQKLLETINGSDNSNIDKEGSPSKRSDRQHIFVQRIMETCEAINKWKKELTDSKKKKSQYEIKYVDNERKKKKKITKVSEDCKMQEEMIRTLSNTLKQYRKELDDINKLATTGQLEFDNSSSSSSSSSDSDTVSESN